MNAQEQRFEVQSRSADDHYFAVDDASIGKRLGERREELGEVSVHRFLIATLQENLVAVSKHESSEAVPFRLELPSITGRQFGGGGGQHRLERRIEWQSHAAILFWSAAACRRFRTGCSLPVAAASRGQQSGAKAPHSKKFTTFVLPL